MTTYTEKALDGASIDGGDSSTKAPSFVLETDEGSQRASDPAYLSDWELDSAASDPVSYKLKKKRWEEQKHEERLAEAKLKDAQRSLESTQQQPIAFHHSGHQEPSEEDDELGPVPSKDAYTEEWEMSSVESSATIWMEKKDKELQDRKHQLNPGQIQCLSTSAHSASLRGDAQGTAGTHDLHGSRVPDKKISQSSPTNHASDNEYSHDYENEESEVTNDTSRKTSKSDRLPLSTSAVVSATPDIYHLEVETFYGRLVINWPMPTAITDLSSEDYYTESSCNSFTALTCTATDLPTQNDTLKVLRPKRFLKPRDIKIVFYIPVTTKTTSSCFKRQWEFITTAVAGLSRRLELGGDDPPPWHNIIILVEGPPKWDRIHLEIKTILTELGILYKTDNLVTKVDGVVLDPPYHKDHCKVFGKMIYGTIHEYSQQSVPNTPVLSIMGTEPLQVIAVAPQWSPMDWASHKPAIPHNWAAAVCEVLKPEFIMSLPEHEIRAIPSPGEFLMGAWTCQIRFRTSKHPEINQCVLTSPDQFQADRKKMITRAEGARGLARRLFGKS
ncbi:hypothetical protein FPHYL_2188 [Fusarium phyllophilum]|uniref:Uncharacterized protein n=1 Tax=Fusarium phyllophilum TaxID=47803 RepID=A0A8H5KB98_9HYPO|nr:hypothetical protein FPHYL_2188 [Fusarium phyllophilum]